LICPPSSANFRFHAKNKRNAEMKQVKPKVANRGQMQPFTQEQIVALTTILGNSIGRHAKRDLALLRVALDTMLRGCDIVRLRVSDVVFNGDVAEYVRVLQQKTGESMTCVLTRPARDALRSYLVEIGTDGNRTLFPMCTRTFRNIVKEWCVMLHLDPKWYSGHSLRRTKARLIYRKTGSVKTVQKLLGHSSMRYTELYLGVTDADALEAARDMEV
jgi:integrase